MESMKFAADFPAVYSENWPGAIFLLHAQVGLEQRPGSHLRRAHSCGDGPENLLDPASQRQILPEYFHPTGVEISSPFAVTARKESGSAGGHCEGGPASSWASNT